MIDPAGNKILIAVDGSDQSLYAVRYVSKMMAPKKTEIVLYHSIRKISEAFWEMGVKPISSQKLSSIRAWEISQEKKIHEFLSLSRQIFLDNGFPEESVKINIHETRKGIARDVYNESKSGYTGVVAGRMGLNVLKDLVLGSVAAKLVEKLHDTPVCLVGGQPRPGKVLLAFDGSEGAMKAVDYTGTMLGNSKSEITLMYVLRGLNLLQPEDKSLVMKEEKALFEDAKTGAEPMFNEAKSRLINAGFDPARITTMPVVGVSSRAGAIVQEAKENGYGTIVVGRRGLSKVAEFFLGGVSNKIIHLAKEMAVWVVS
ncbi:MAG: hypothetical protein B1H11_10165 [Desulfobacteraceae bacterium 4484_190.1]|nr:MAG: hypothetical protein B1H11_10165 [Desulfobacteraceae bacterium 4484_190.1]